MPHASIVYYWTKDALPEPEGYVLVAGGIARINKYGQWYDRDGFQILPPPSWWAPVIGSIDDQ